MNKPELVKNFLRIFNILLIIFLTGCAAQRYHKNVVQAPGSPGASRGGAEHLSFRRPLEGRVLMRYGEREDGVALKGIVIQGAEGQEVLAAQRGRVAYADDSLRGYGKTVILEHAAGYSTVYARNSELLVGAGEEVQMGRPIARAGRGGKGGFPQVYFEVRQDSRTLDPESVLS